ncbi:MAG: TlyA family rRNA (cytidine-2'-O)-methyltransferase [Phycisphaerae bacterium]|jgi:23S rRNA (cytidine1920-2'-O)/16S rRNA (cytidine1409-2'-O)-methyltransferase
MSAGGERYVTRAGLKLEAALREFQLSVAGLTCVDFGSHAGGFVDCLLQHGAARVYAVDPGYGVLDYRLRNDPRVVVFERTNALRFACPELCDLVTIDAGWTRQRVILPAAARALRPGGCVVTLVKPQYEAPPRALRRGVLAPDQVEPVLREVELEVVEEGWRVAQRRASPIAGHGGNVEWLWLLERAN